MRPLVVATGILALAAGPALAQSNAMQAGNVTAAQMGSDPLNHGSAAHNSGSLRQTLRHDLQKAGFTHISVIPEAFAVHARNSAGQPVFMVISPDSLTEITPVAGTGHDSSGQSMHAQNGNSENNNSNGGSNTQ